MRKITLWIALGASLPAQDLLSLRAAIDLALRQHPSIAASQSSVDAAESRIRQAASGKLPRLNFSESWQRSNNPVFVFSSLLTQRQFGEEDFALKALNNPASLNNFQSMLVLEQPIFDAGVARNSVRTAELSKEVAAEDKRRTEQEVMCRVVGAYFGVLLATDLKTVADSAVASAQASMERAEALRSAGMSTDADVLSIQVHLASMREQQIRRQAGVRVAEAALNDALGAPLDSRFSLVTKLSQPTNAAVPLSVSEAESERSRPEVRQARLAVTLSETQSETARAAFLPQIFFRAVAEADRQGFVTRAGANWMAGVTLRWNLFNGYADRSRMDEIAHSRARAKALERQTAQGVKLQVRRASADLDSARERVSVAESAVAQAEESLRIIKNRYAAGLTTITELLRSEVALLEVRSRQLLAFYEQRAAGVALELAAGTLRADSEVLR